MLYLCFPHLFKAVYNKIKAKHQNIKLKFFKIVKFLEFFILLSTFMLQGSFVKLSKTLMIQKLQR